MSSQSLGIDETPFPVARTGRHEQAWYDWNLRESFRSVLGASIQRVVALLPLWCWFVPCTMLALLLLAGGPCLPLFVGKYAWTGKDFQEILGPSFLGGAVTVAGFQCLMRGSRCRVWLFCIAATLLCRELHFAGTGTGVYLALGGLAWYGVRHARQLEPIWQCRHLCGCLFSAGCLYALAVSVDSGVWKFLPLSSWWSVNLEETLESTGHFFILLSAICGTVLADKPAAQ